MLHPSDNFAKPAPSHVLDRKWEIKIGLPWYKDGRLIIGVSGAGLHKLLLRVDRLLVKPAPTALLKIVQDLSFNSHLAPVSQPPGIQIPGSYIKSSEED